MIVTWDGNVVIQHDLRFLVTARSQIRFGWDPSLDDEDTFHGLITASPPWLF